MTLARDPFWMMFVFLIPYCLGGIAGPALQSLITQQVGPDEQGELQGGLTSLQSVTTILGPLLASNLFAHFTSTSASIYFPGAAFFMAGVLVVVGWFVVMRSVPSSRSV